MSGNAERNIRPCARVMPAIYGFVTPEIARHNGWIKIGYTERTVEERGRELFHTADVEHDLVLTGNAVYEVDKDGSAPPFKDHDFHAYLLAQGIERKPKTEWFRISVEDAERMLHDFRYRRHLIPEGEPEPYELRPEQERAVEKTMSAFLAGAEEFLWNAKPRFGKTLSVYDLMKRSGMSRILVVTNRPAVADSWHSDYVKFVGGKSGTAFLLSNQAVAKEKYVSDPVKSGVPDRCIAFTSLQDLKGADWAGGQYKKLEWIRDKEWDMMVVDESHEGASTDKADAAFLAIRRRFTLWLSGTPFKQIASGRFPPDRIFDWTYGDEQAAKAAWDGDTRNPYEEMPKLSLYTYRISDIVRDELAAGFDDDGREWMFSLGEFFRTDRNGAFVHEGAVDRFLDALSSQPKFPFSPDFRDPDDPDKELRHTFWLLDRVDSARALGRKLEAHPVFGKYRIVVAAGSGRDYDKGMSQKDIENVRAAITDDSWHTRTITISVGKLTTGVTIPELTGIMMLCNVESPALYMQTAFRAQNPCLFRDGSNSHRKFNAYVFDFDPARTLEMFGDFADGLCPGGAARNDAERKRRIGELLNFFPVIGEDPGGEMVELDAERVLSVPKEVYAARVVETGFMANCLFRNVGAVFSASQDVIDVINKFTPAEEPKRRQREPADLSGVELDPETGEVAPQNGTVVGLQKDLFGDAVYAPGAETVATASAVFASGQDGPAAEPKTKDNVVTALVDQVAGDAILKGIIEPIRKSESAKVLGAKKVKEIEKKAIERVKSSIVPVADGFSSGHDDIVERHASGSISEAEYHSELLANARKATEDTMSAIGAAIEEARYEAAAECAAAAMKKKKATAEEKIRDQLRGFSRTIPSFLMAYGTPDTTLDTFDLIVPDAVFKEVTGITMDEFRLLRNGGDVQDDVAGTVRHFDGVFDEGVFNGAVRLFMQKRGELAGWFDEGQQEDIFDYIPPQKTNQIYTPRDVAKYMVDELGKESPGCFEDETKTFIDLYMKSGMYIVEIVKRLYGSSKLKALYPDGKARLKHIFEEQVYGLAPTEIIYRIAMAYIFGFDPDEKEVSRKNFKCADALKYAKAGTLQEKLDELFG